MTSPEDIKARDQFSKIFHAGWPVLTEIVAALEDNGVANKQLSILALKSMGEMSYLMPLLSRKDEPAVRKGAGCNQIAHGAWAGGLERCSRAACRRVRRREGLGRRQDARRLLVARSSQPSAPGAARCSP